MATCVRPLYSTSFAPRFVIRCHDLQHAPFLSPSLPTCSKYSRSLCRSFGSSAARCEQQQERRHHRSSFFSQLRVALENTKTVWYPIPVGLGIAFLGSVQFYRTQKKAKEQEREEHRSVDTGESGDKDSRRPKKRKRIRPSGPWQVQVMSTLPLKAVSRVWGRFNELEIPYPLRVPGFKLYGWIFGVNFTEVSEPDLHVYPNLASFFYRTLKPGCRPLDPNPLAVLSPADGRILQFGLIEGGEVEQVKGMTYSLDALLGTPEPADTRSTSPNPSSPAILFADHSKDQSPSSIPTKPDADNLHADEEFARVNGISYTLPNLLSGGPNQSSASDGGTSKHTTDASTTPRPSSESEVRADFALGDSTLPWYHRFGSSATKEPTSLHYAVVYLAPGDYHRFHSPTSWVVTTRRHFAGELYSVSPYLQRILPGLFTLNERVVLLGRWRWGFFSVTPVGATNVGSIKINFDKELRTNSLTTDTAADRAAEEAARKGEPNVGFAEATYRTASPLLGGYSLKRGEEMGGFQLGSSVVMVFEAPRGRWKWSVEKGQRVKMGEAMGEVLQGEA